MTKMQENKEIIDELKSTFERLIDVNNKIISDLPIEHQQKVLPIQLDINEILQHVKNGDLNKIQEISKKYGCSNTK
jgi:hypothetical protein